MKGLGVARVVLAGGVGAALVLGASRVDGSIDLAPPPADAPAADAAAGTSPVAQRGLLCPGPERLGIPGGPDTNQTVRVLAAAAPDAVVPQRERSSAKGSLTVRRLPGEQDHKPGPQKSVATASTAIDGPEGALLLASGAFAPGAAAMQYSLVPKGDHRALSTVACGLPAAQSWLVAGGAEPGRLERVVLVNPGANAVTVDLDVLGSGGPVSSDNGQGIVVPARGRTAVLLDSIAGSEKTPVVHVTAHGGEVYAAINDAWLDGVVPRGGDTSVATAPPAEEQVIGGVSVDGSISLRVAVPGDAQAVVQTRVLTAKGPRRVKHDVVRVPGQSARDIDLSDLPAGDYAIQVRADVPVVASATVDRGRGNSGGAGTLDRRASDLAWTPSSTAIDGVAGTPLPRSGSPSLANRLLLGNTGPDATVAVTTVDRRGKATTHRVTVPADSVRSVDAGPAASVWVRTRSEAVHGAVVTTTKGTKKVKGTKDQSALVAALPLVSAPLTRTEQPIRPAGG